MSGPKPELTEAELRQRNHPVPEMLAHVHQADDDAAAVADRGVNDGKGGSLADQVHDALLPVRLTCSKGYSLRTCCASVQLGGAVTTLWLVGHLACSLALRRDRRRPAAPTAPAARQRSGPDNGTQNGPPGVTA